MAKALSLTELRNMQEADLLKEIAEKRRESAKLRMSVKLGKEKGSHLYKQAKKELARMLTVLSQLRRGDSQGTITAPKKL